MFLAEKRPLQKISPSTMCAQSVLLLVDDVTIIELNILPPSLLVMS
jgi:hypothetical protein